VLSATFPETFPTLSAARRGKLPAQLLASCLEAAFHVCIVSCAQLTLTSRAKPQATLPLRRR
jgi:hypothetical protein